MGTRFQDIFNALARAIWLGTGLIILLWFLDSAIAAVLFGLAVVVLAIALNAPVTWLENKGIGRVVGLLLILTGIAGTFIALAYVAVPRVVEQATQIATDTPSYSRIVERRATEFFDKNPSVRARLVGEEGTLTDSVLPVLRSFVTRLGRYTVSLMGLLTTTLLLGTSVLYAVAKPRPLLHGFLGLFPAHLRRQAARAFAKSSQSIVGWLWSNVILGVIEAVSSGIFLSWLGIPGAFVWAALAFFCELLPYVGAYLAAIPPILIALAIDPGKAVWVALFYIVLQFVSGELLGPFVQAKKMQIHAVSVIVATMAMGAAFGLIGVILALPVVGIVKAFYDEFYTAASIQEGEDELRLKEMLNRTVT